MKTIHAHTETGASHPGYVNISDQLAALAADVAAFLAPAEAPAAAGKVKG